MLSLQLLNKAFFSFFLLFKLLKKTEQGSSLKFKFAHMRNMILLMEETFALLYVFCRKAYSSGNQGESFRVRGGRGGSEKREQMLKNTCQRSRIHPRKQKKGKVAGAEFQTKQISKDQDKDTAKQHSLLI